MLPILNKPVMETIVDLLRDHGVRQIVVNTSYLADEIESYFRDGSRFGVEMAYSFEGVLRDGGLRDEPVGSAGAIRRIQDHSGFFDEPFFVLCGDAVIDLDLTALARFHREHGAVATIAMARVAPCDVSSYGIVVTDAEGRIRSFQEKPAASQARSDTANTGIYLFEPEVVERIPRGQNFDIGSQLFPALVKDDARFFGVVLPFQWLDIGRTPDYYRVVRQALEGTVARLAIPGRQIAPGIHVGLNVALDLNRCAITPPVYVGGSSRIQPGACIVGPSWIDTGCVVESGAHIASSIVLPNTRVGSLANLEGVIACGSYCVAGDGAVVEIHASDLGWVLCDSRAPHAPPLAGQEQLFRLLQQEQSREEVIKK